ncbi:MAG TPA: type I methionyl aminopeptidase [Candidatus Sumerlaeota bacterium]|nr:type I methionyl aminopeptidase [Candidatus Sumerlaeota bacterium]
MIRGGVDRLAGIIKSREEIELMRKAGRELAEVREALAAMVRPGITTLDLDQAAYAMIEELGAKPSFLGYGTGRRAYPATICASINEEIVHGIPSAKRRLHDGDLISIDVGLFHYGFHSDTAVTVAVGDASAEIHRLIEITRRSLEIGIEVCRPGARLGDVSNAIQSYVESFGLSVVREYTGHGIGREMHEEPRIPNYGPAGRGIRLREGMVLAIEPMVNLGDWRTQELDDEWTVITADHKPSAHFEHTVALTENGAEILTV